MAIKSAYCPEAEPDDGRVVVTGDEHRHLKVSRTVVGEAIEAFDGQGRVWSGKIESVEKKTTTILIEDERTVPPPAAEIILVQALIKTSPFEWLLEKAVEVGVTRIVPFRAERSNVSERDRGDRWRRIIVEAAKQTKQYRLPRLDPVDSLDRALGLDVESRVLFSEQGGGSLESAVSGAPVLYAIGPEGGWTAEEIALARGRGVREVHLGSNILRSETAAIVGAALIGYELGVL